MNEIIDTHSDLSVRCEQVFDDQCLSRTIVDYRERPEQRTMAIRVANAIANGENLIVEAGTGIGKTVAYLIPAILSGKKILISTSTKVLQEQIYEKDLPMLLKALEISAEVKMLKGRENYLCRYRLEEAEADLFADDADFRHKITDWVAKTSSGDIAKIPDVNPSDTRLRSLIMPADQCTASRCPYYSDCFVFKTRKRALTAKIVVINHYLLSSDMELKMSDKERFQDIDIILIDEAHNLPDIVDRNMAIKVDDKQIENLMNNLKKSDAWHTFSEIRDAAQNMRAASMRLQKVLSTLCDEQGGEDDFNKGQFKHASGELADALNVLSYEFKSLSDKGQIDDENVDGHCFEHTERIRQDLQNILDVSEENVRWFNCGTNSYSLYATPLNIADKYSACAKDYSRNWIYVSGTLSARGDFSYFKNKLGLESESLSLQSPYDYAKQAMLYIPEMLPSNESAASDLHTEEFVNLCAGLFDKMDGSAFLLFTSKKALNKAYEILQAYDGDKQLLVQGMTASKEQLIEKIRTRQSILLGLTSFWEGIDVRNLRLVAINRLPFAPPEPLSAMRRERLYQGNSFMQVDVPEAIIKLRQGVGRLIRNENDKGVVIIGDSRIKTKSYGKAFLESLPPFKHGKALSDVLPYLSG